MRAWGFQEGPKAAEQEPGGAAEQFRSLFEEAPVAYHQTDRKGIVRRVNRAECALLGLKAEEILGKHVWELLVPEQRERSRGRSPGNSARSPSNSSIFAGTAPG